MTKKGTANLNRVLLNVGPETRILPPCQTSNRRKAILIKYYSLSLSSKLDGSVLLIIADFLDIWGYYLAGRRYVERDVFVVVSAMW